MKQVLFGGRYDALSNVAIEYAPIGCSSNWTTTESARAVVVSAPGAIDRLFVELDAAPGSGAGDAYRFTLRLNGADTTLTCTITQPDVAGSDVTHSVAVVAGDVITIQSEYLNTPSETPRAQYAVRFTGTNVQESLLVGNLYGVNNAALAYHSVQGLSADTATENDARQVCPTAGTISDLYINCSEDPGTDPDAYRVTLRLNGASTTLTCTVTANATTANDTTHSVAVVAGDVLTMMAEPLNSPSATPNIAFGMTFTADTDGESIITGGYNDPLDNAATEYNILVNGSYTVAWTATEAAAQELGLSCTLRKLHVLLSAAPGAGNTYTFTPRVNAASPADGLSVAITGTDTTGSDLTHSVVVADSDNLALMCVPDSSPDAANAYWGLVQYISTIKSVNGLVWDSVKTINGQTQATTATINGWS